MTEHHTTESLRWSQAGAEQGRIEALGVECERYRRAIKNILDLASDDAGSGKPAIGGYTTLIISAIARHALEKSKLGDS